jgi:hypothetical protein
MHARSRRGLSEGIGTLPPCHRAFTVAERSHRGLGENRGVCKRRIEAMKRKTSKIQQLRAVRLNPRFPPNIEKLPRQLKRGKSYVVLGEVSNIDHYILLDLETGRIVPGMWHLNRFEDIPHDDI